VQRPFGATTRNVDGEGLLAAAQRAEVGNRSVKADQAQQAFDEPGRLPQRHAEQHLHRMHPISTCRRSLQQRRWVMVCSCCLSNRMNSRCESPTVRVVQQRHSCGGRCLHQSFSSRRRDSLSIIVSTSDAAVESRLAPGFRKVADEIAPRRANTCFLTARPRPGCDS
jgi:hypothetical protein